VDLRLIQASTPAGTPNPASLRSKGSLWNPALDEALVTATRVLVNAPKPLRVGDGVIVHLPKGPDLWNETFATPADSAPPHTAIARFQAPKIGCTITDLVAPFFVFIVGVVIPFGSLHRNAGWFHHALRRCLFLIGAGILYLSLIGPLSLSWWWGILQAICVAYLVGVLLYQFPALPRLGILLALALFHEVMTRQFHWWTELGDPNKVFFSVGNWRMNRDFDFLRPLELHCTPWASIGYGLCTVLGTFIGEAIKARHAIARTCLVVGISATVVGLILNSVGFPMHKEFVTTSYALFTSGIAALTYLGFYLVMDRAGYQTWAWPLEVFGQNALFAYFSQVLVGGILLERFGITAFFTGAPFDPSHPLAGAWWTSKAGYMGLAYGALYTFILWLATLYANRRGWYWKL
jgi:predicted acyltransferase